MSTIDQKRKNAHLVGRRYVNMTTGEAVIITHIGHNVEYGLFAGVGHMMIRISDVGTIWQEQEAVTHDQRRVIGYIEQNLSIEFKGNTRTEARQWITEHMDASKEAWTRLNDPDVADLGDERDDWLFMVYPEEF